MDDDDSLIIKEIPAHYQKVMLARGAGRMDMMFRNDRFNVEQALAKIKLDVFGATPKIIATGKQAKTLERVLENPLRGSYTLGISSYPTDQRARHLASYIMYKALAAYPERKRAGRTLPKWHKVFGGYNDPMRDNSKETPSLLIISNVVAESTGIKLEKVRDLLEKYDRIPRIVVCGGTDAASLFANTLHYPLSGVIHLGPENKIDD